MGVHLYSLTKKNLERELKDSGASDFDIYEIKQMLKERQYMQACQRHFAALHHGAPAYMQNHPNKYFEQSMKFYNGPNKENTNSQ